MNSVGVSPDDGLVDAAQVAGGVDADVMPRRVHPGPRRCAWTLAHRRRQETCGW